MDLILSGRLRKPIADQPVDQGHYHGVIHSQYQHQWVTPTEYVVGVTKMAPGSVRVYSWDDPTFMPRHSLHKHSGHHRK